MKNFDFGKYCTPAQLYLILAGISLLTAFFQNFRVVTLGVNFLFVVIWAWVLNWLCTKGLGSISWVLVLLPFVLFAANFFMAMDVADNVVKEGFAEGVDGEGDEDDEDDEDDEGSMEEDYMKEDEYE